MVHFALKKTSKTAEIKCTLQVPENVSKFNLCIQELNLGPEGGRERKTQLHSAMYMANFTRLF